MKLILRIFRIPELLFIALTQYMFRYCIVKPYFGEVALQVNNWQFLLLVIATILVAAGGFVMKYYFDTRHYDEKFIERFYGKAPAFSIKIDTLAFVLLAAGSLLGILVGYGIGMFNLGLVFMLAATVLYYYALRYQGLMFWGNMVIGFLIALIPSVVWLFEYFAIYKQLEIFTVVMPVFRIIGYFTIAYAAYLFVLAFILKIIIDLQKTEWDRDCFFKTFPIVLGEKKSRILSATLLACLILAIFILQCIAYKHNMQYYALVLLILVQAPLFFTLVKILKAQKKEDYQLVSNLLKWNMVLGILSMAAANPNIFTKWIA